MVPVLGGEVEEGEQSFPILRQAGDRLVVVGAVFVGDTSIATSAAARVGASRVSTAEKFFAQPTDAAESGNLATDLILRLGRRRLVALGLDLPDRSGASRRHCLVDDLRSEGAGIFQAARRRSRPP